MRLWRITQAASLAICASAFAVRDTSFNQTAPWDSSQSRPSQTKAEGPLFKPRPSEIAVDGFETVGLAATTTSIKQNVVEGRLTTTSKPDVGSLIESILNTVEPRIQSSAVGVHFERSEDGWGELTPGAAVPSEVKNPLFSETRGGGSGPTMTGGLPPSNMPQAIPLAGVTPQVTIPPVVPLPQVTPPPAITYSGITLQPVAVTSVRVLTIDGKPTTVSSIVSYRYAVGTDRLQIGSTTTINNVVIAVNIDSAGSTVLVAGDRTTTLPPPAQVLQQVQTASIVQAVKITTTVIEGTTKYVLAGQTLAPGQAVTVNGISISITVQSQLTILVVGDKTTTFAGSPITIATTEWDASASTTFGAGSGNTNSQSAATSVGAGSSNKSWLLTNLVGVAALMRPFV
ncbi:hypothetical protein CC86DRAFT_382286 [Ophiobolus disseminans]|uniref:Uncharacterized protein n=1 Tax=Ophiobolus disseminans TaxID=1469910 RepID=A0A6A7A0A2_9PLEO|nr:hypothetical protein CC86DRAFT_382286 [Ophiobolus disseminans]